jgi:hypothetical protein
MRFSDLADNARPALRRRRSSLLVCLLLAKAFFAPWMLRGGGVGDFHATWPNIGAAQDPQSWVVAEDAADWGAPRPGSAFQWVRAPFGDSLQRETTGAGTEERKCLKPSDSVSQIGDRARNQACSCTR